MPSGCSEQQFKSWIPNIVAIKYLKSVNKLTTKQLQDGESYLATGYQQLLGRRKSDGSYSLWGESGDSSIWLTAYVAKLLGFAKDFVTINDRHLVGALSYFTSRQKADGSFPELVRDYYYIKSKSQGGVPLTAFCAIAILENGGYKADYKLNIDRALSYINSKVTTINDNFAFATAAYAFALNNHAETDSFLDQLKTNAIMNDDQMFWYREGKSLSTSESPSVNVEIAAYALMAFVEKNRLVEAVKIMNWLMTQRNSAGGFYSTTDTVIGMQALAKIATRLHVASTNMDVKLEYEKGRKKNFKISPANAMTLQVQELEKDTRDISVNVAGTGFAYFQVSYSYNTILDEPNERFAITAVPQQTGSVLKLKICTNFIVEGDQKQSHMTLVEVYLPSGYVYDKQTAEMVKAANVRVSRTVLKSNKNAQFSLTES
jgi:CD109 antigen